MCVLSQILNTAFLLCLKPHIQGELLLFYNETAFFLPISITQDFVVEEYIKLQGLPSLFANSTF